MVTSEAKKQFLIRKKKHKPKPSFFLQDKYRKIASDFSEKLKSEATPSELMLKKCFEQSKMDFMFQYVLPYRKDKFFILDFLVMNERGDRFCIEVDGGYHYLKRQQKQDTYRSRIIMQQNINIIRIRNEKLEKQPGETWLKLMNALHSLEPIRHQFL